MFFRNLLKCVLYIAGIGILSNIIGNALPRRWFHADRFPYKCWKWENGGKIYRKLKIQKWKDKLPDMSKVDPTMYRKEVDTARNPDNLQRLIDETCVAEIVHDVLIVLSLAVVDIWPGVWGWIVWVCCFFGNFPFVLIQRYNRPRLQKALDRMKAHSVPKVSD